MDRILLVIKNALSLRVLWTSICLLLSSFVVSLFAFPQTTDIIEQEFHHVDVATFDYEKVTHTLELVLDSGGLPQYYYASLVTPVCDDSICEVLYLDMYWDLLGNYLRFDTLPGLPLTKFGHARFSSAEYERLHGILLDSHSPLGQLEMEDLVNNEAKYDSGVIDAISGATNVDIAGSTVQGAVYSSYILWQIAHAEAQDIILLHTRSLLDEKIIRYMLKCDNYNYQIFLLSSFTNEQYLLYQNDIVNLISTESPNVLSYFIGSMPSSFLLLETVQIQMCSRFSHLSVLLRYQFLMRLSRCNIISLSCLEILSRQIDVMSYMQAQEYADILIRYKGDLTEETLLNVKLIVDDAEFKYSFVFNSLFSIS